MGVSRVFAPCARTWKLLLQRLTLVHIGPKLTHFHQPLGAFQVQRNIGLGPLALSERLLLQEVAIEPALQVELLPCAASSTWTWVNQLATLCSTTRMTQDNHFLPLGGTWEIYLRELLRHREGALSGIRIFFSESAEFHLVFWVFCCVVLGCVCVRVCLFRLWNT